MACTACMLMLLLKKELLQFCECTSLCFLELLCNLVEIVLNINFRWFMLHTKVFIFHGFWRSLRSFFMDQNQVSCSNGSWEFCTFIKTKLPAHYWNLEVLWFATGLPFVFCVNYSRNTSGLLSHYASENGKSQNGAFLWHQICWSTQNILVAAVHFLFTEFHIWIN